MNREELEKLFEEKFCIECPEGGRRGQLILNQIYPDKIQDFIFDVVIKKVLESVINEPLPLFDYSLQEMGYTEAIYDIKMNIKKLYNINL